jgi:hypothetical protein
MQLQVQACRGPQNCSQHQHSHPVHSVSVGMQQLGDHGSQCVQRVMTRAGPQPPRCSTRWHVRSCECPLEGFVVWFTQLPTVFCVTPAPVLPQDEELPPWLRREKMQKLADAEGGGLPFGLYLLASSLVAIATVGNAAKMTCMLAHRACYNCSARCSVPL